jgi:RNA polymerase sigma-54 factor
LNLGFDISQRLQQKLSFQMIQSLKLLQVNTLQLEQMLRAELEQNPVLELEDDIETDAELEAEERLDDGDEIKERDEDEYLEELVGGEDGIDWEEYLDEGFDLGYSYNEESDPSEERYESAPVYRETLEESLTKQLAEKKNLDERTKLLVQFLIGSLDDDGYLRLPIKDIADFTGAAVSEVEDALGVLRKLDPAGVGARDLRECMTLQLRARGMEGSLAMTIVADHWACLEKLRIPEISRRLETEPRLVQEAIDIIKTLDPKPGCQFSADKSSTIIPDLIVEKVDGKFIAALNDRSVPSLCINKSYADMIRRGSKARKDVKEYVREKFNSATWFIKSIEQRRTTILKVMYAIIDRQKTFFEKGPPNLAPLKQQDVADIIEMNISTVSRVTSNKYVQTQHGIFELKYFFTEAVRQKQIADGGEGVGEDDDGGDGGSGVDVTAGRVKNRIRQLVDDEDPKKPLTDQRMAEILEEDGLPAARRTVAKYREQMKILPARMRQKYE